MLYHLRNGHFADFNTFAINKLAPRAYFIPFSTAQKATSVSLLEERYSSDMVRILSGKDWDFCFIENPETLPEPFDSDTVSFDKVKVPSCWQFTGYAKPVYSNVAYLFKPNPPHIPTVKVEPFTQNVTRINPTDAYNNIGIYRTFFDVSGLQDKTRKIAFLGVISSLDLYVNGQFVGYSEGAHNTAEFNLDKYLKEGQNELIACVRRWSTGSYLECQDMFRNNGIFRDVLLYETPVENVLDYEIKTKKKENGYDLSLDIWVENATGQGSLSVEFSVGGRTYKTTATAEEKTSFFFADLPVAEWSAEKPVLYDLIISLNSEEYFRVALGFKNIVIRNAVYYLNDAPIKYLGVNHHDTSPTQGYYLTPEEIERDVRLMKEFNVNSVRTSHYPPDPLFLQLCAKYGLYVVDEADIETHGMSFSGKTTGAISKNLAWKHHYWDRMYRMFMRDRNCVAVCMWSMGNESGGCKCQDYCYGNFKKLTDIPIHYEGASHYLKRSYDIMSEMYTPISFMRRRLARAIATHGKRYRPYFLCEYAHAMGVGPGSLSDYYNLFMTSEHYLGGCIWEWADHAVLEKDGSYTYGGDHGEYLHDGNFCVDGLFYPDRRPSRSAFEMKNVYRPVDAHCNGKTLNLHNRRYFTDTSDLLIKLVIRIDDRDTVESFHDISIAPQETKAIPIELPKSKNIDLLVSYIDKETQREVGFDQIILAQTIEPSYTIPKKVNQPEIKVSDLDDLITIQTEHVSYVFDKNSCTITHMEKDGVEFVNQNPVNRHGIVGSYTELFRAPFDNDRNIQKVWRTQKIDSYTIKPTYLFSEQHPSVFSVFVNFSIRGKRPIAIESNKITFLSDGSVVYDVLFTGYMISFLPRIGKVFEWDPKFTKTQWFGMGDGEGYPDLKSSLRIGKFTEHLTCQEEEPYIFPQHTGTKCDVKQATLSTEDGTSGIQFFALKRPFYWTAKNYTEKEVDLWKHRPDVHDLPSAVTTVDGFFRGIGTNSCGPLPLWNYTLSGFFRQYHYKFRILPFNNK